MSSKPRLFTSGPSANGGKHHLFRRLISGEREKERTIQMPATAKAWFSRHLSRAAKAPASHEPAADIPSGICGSLLPRLGRFAGGLGGSLPLVAILLLGLGVVSLCSLPAAHPATAAAANDGCANAELRTGFSASLPDCRAYERVSPPGSRAYLSTGNPPQVYDTQTSTAGDRITWRTYYPLDSASSYQQRYLSTRGDSGWSTEAVTPPQSQFSSALVNCAPKIYFSPSLSRAVLSDGFNGDGYSNGGECGSADPPLPGGALTGSRNLYLQESDTGSDHLIRLTAAGVPPTASELGHPAGNATFQDASDDFSKVVFSDTAELTSNSPDPLGLYMWNESKDAVHLVSVLPDGTAVSGILGNGTQHAGPGTSMVGGGSYQGAAPYTGAVSADGTRVFFAANGNLYLRENADQEQSPIDAGVCTDETAACTIQVDASQGSGPGGSGSFQWASDDGSKVYFTAPQSTGLTADTTSGSGSNLYLYDVATGDLTNLTPAATDVRGMSGLSADGSYAYFVADGSLAPGAPSGPRNLYLAHGGTTTYIATLSSSDNYDWNLSFLKSRVSPSGEYFAFDSTNSLTSYDSQGTEQIYLYDAAADELSCASCDPTGAPPKGPSAMEYALQISGQAPAALQRSLLDNGRLFFNSPNVLVPQASNGKSNVYEFEPNGVGSCEEPAGCTHLISSGTSNSGSYFYGASESGDDAFFITNQNLVGDGGDSPPTIYDARVGGGFAQPNVPAPCSGEGCKDDPPPPPADDNPGSNNAHPGNVQVNVKRCRHLKRRAHKATSRARSLRKKARRAGSRARRKSLRKKARSHKDKAQRLETKASGCWKGSK